MKIYMIKTNILKYNNSIICTHTYNYDRSYFYITDVM